MSPSLAAELERQVTPAIAIMRSHWLFSLVTAFAVLAGCVQDRRQQNPQAAVGATGATSGAMGPTHCMLGAPIRLTRDSVAGFPVRIGAGELQRRCGEAAVLDTVGVGGDVAIALRVVSGSDTLWAIQDDNTTLNPNQAITSWRVTLRRVQMSDGTVAPTTIGALRHWDSTAVVVADRGDDTDGDYAVRCMEPRVVFTLGEAPLPSDSGAWSLARRPLPDSVRIVQAEVLSHVTPALAEHCPGAPVT